MAPSIGWQVKLGMDPASAVSTEQYEVTLAGLRVEEELIDAAGLRGTRSHVSERVRQGIRSPGLTLTMQPNSVELDLLLPRILGGAESLDTFPLAETLPTFFVNLDLGQQRWHFNGCKVNRAVFSGETGRPLDLELDIEALDVTPSATAFPTLAISAVGPYMFHDLVAQVNAMTKQFRSVRLTIDNSLDVGRHLNSQTRTAIPERDRIITWEFDGPYGDNSDLYGLAVAGVAALATFTNGTRSLQFSSTKVQFPRVPPVVNGREEIFLPLQGIARKDGATLELVTINDSTP